MPDLDDENSQFRLANFAENAVVTDAVAPQIVKLGAAQLPSKLSRIV